MTISRTSANLSIQGVFGMNVIELNTGTHGTIVHYVAAALPLTFVTIWIIVAFQSRFVLRDNQAMWKKLLWPVALIQRLISQTRRRPEDDSTSYLPL
jgi:heme A synthase